MTTALRTPSTRRNPRSGRSHSSTRSHLRAVSPSPTERRSRLDPPLPHPRTQQRTSASPRSANPAATVRQLPTRRPLPPWLQLLIQVQRGSVVVTFVLVTAALVVYGSTIYMQQHWSKGYNKLKSMQRSERQMIAAEGLIKNQLIQQAEKPESGLVPRRPQHTVVLEQSPDRLPATVNPVVEPEPQDASAPLGY